MNLYLSVFENSEIVSISRYGNGEEGPAGKVRHAVFSSNDQPFMCIDSAVKHDFSFTPATSLSVSCDTGVEVDRIYDVLSENGEVFMPLDAYPFSKNYAWFSDRFGVSWQVALEDV